MNIIRNSEEKNRAALLVQYDGTNFNGWQVQKKGRTVQGEIEKALELLLKERLGLLPLEEPIPAYTHWAR